MQTNSSSPVAMTMLTPDEKRAFDLLKAAQDAKAIHSEHVHDLEVVDRVADVETELRSWLEAIPEGERFLQVAHDGTGSMFCIWVRHRAIVFFGSDGEHPVVAACFQDWLRLLAAGGVWDCEGWAEQRQQNQLARFLTERGVVPGGDAGSQHAPELQQWVRRHTPAPDPGPQGVWSRALDIRASGALIQARDLLEATITTNARARASFSATLVTWYLEDHQPERALQAADAALPLALDPKPLFALRGKALLALDRHHEAIDALRLSHEHPSVLRDLARAIEATGGNGTPERVRADHNDGPLRAVLTRIEDTDDVEQRANMAQAWLDSHDNDAHPGAAARARAILHDATARASFSIEDYRSAFETAEEERVPAAQAELGLALWQAGHNQDAWDHLEAAAMSLSSSSALTPRVFAALEELEGIL
jgi:hypothetical protein